VKTVTAGDSVKYPATSVPAAAAFCATIGGSPPSPVGRNSRPCSWVWEAPGRAQGLVAAYPQI